MDTILEQSKTFRAELGPRSWITATVRHDDNCGNGHNTFSITGELYEGGEPVAFGCLHDEIAAHFPTLAPLIKWHLCSTDGPLHYIANTLYLAGDRDWRGQPGGKAPDLDAARSVAIWPEATPEQLNSEEALQSRLPALLAEFQAAVESIGFTF